MQFGFVLGFVGVDSAYVLLGFHLVAALDGDIFKIGIDRKVFAVADDDNSVASRQFCDAGHFAFKDGTGFGTFGGGNVDTVIGHGDFVRHDGSVFAVR